MFFDCYCILVSQICRKNRVCMATIEERNGKNGKTYQVRIRVKGHPPVTETFKRKTDAKKWALQTEADIRQGIFFPKADFLTKTFDDAYKRYNQHIIDKHFTEKEAQYVRHMLQFWHKELGRKLLREIASPILIECRDKLATHKKPNGDMYSPSTVNRYLVSVSHIFKVAMNEWGWIKENPMKNVSSVKESKGRDRYLSNIEKSKLLDVCAKSESPYLYPVIMIALTTGGRRSEIMNLEWRDIDFKRDRIIYRDTKNTETRSVPMVDTVKIELKKLRSVPRIDTPYVFPRKDGLKPLEIKKHWLKAFEEAGLKDFKFHDLRHTAASYLAMSGSSLLEIAQILGHKTMDMVKRYAHLTDNHTAMAVGRMNKMFIENNSSEI